MKSEGVRLNKSSNRQATSGTRQLQTTQTTTNNISSSSSNWETVKKQKVTQLLQSTSAAAPANTQLISDSKSPEQKRIVLCLPIKKCHLSEWILSCDFTSNSIAVMKRALVVYLAFALAVCSKGSLAALDASPAETASSNNLVQDKHDFQVRTSTLSAGIKG